MNQPGAVEEQHSVFSSVDDVDQNHDVELGATKDDESFYVRINTKRLENYLQNFKNKIAGLELALLEQQELIHSFNKAEETKIAKLAVKLDHCIVDVNSFKDVVLSTNQKTPIQEGLNTNTYLNEAMVKDKAEPINFLQMEVAALGLLVRRTEAHQAEGLESFGQIKNLNSVLKNVKKELDSLGKNSVILELRDYVNRCVSDLQNSVRRGKEERDADMAFVTESLQTLQEEQIEKMEFRLQNVEEKLSLYDVLINPDGAETEQESGDDELAESEPEPHRSDHSASLISAPHDGTVVLKGGHDNNSLRNSLVENLHSDNKVPMPSLESEGSTPLKPSEMLRYDTETAGYDDEDKDLADEEGFTDTVGVGEVSVLSTAVANSVDCGQPHLARQSLRQRVPDPKLRASFASTTAAVKFNSGPPSRERRFQTDIMPRGKISKGRQSVTSSGAALQRESVAFKARSSVVESSSNKSIGRGKSSTASRTSSFFGSMMSQYVSNETFEAKCSELSDSFSRTVLQLSGRMKLFAASQLLKVFSRANFHIVSWKIKHGFFMLVQNVKNWNAVRDRRNRAKALMFNVRLNTLCNKHLKVMGFEHWARTVWLCKERERLRLHLRNIIGHIVDIKVPNLKIYMNRWKRFTVHTYYISLFENESDSAVMSGLCSVFVAVVSVFNVVLLLYTTVFLYVQWVYRMIYAACLRVKISVWVM
jgi:hypothetical protein